MPGYFVSEGRVKDVEAKLFREMNKHGSELKHVSVRIEPVVGVVVHRGKQGKLISVEGRGKMKAQRILFRILKHG